MNARSVVALSLALAVVACGDSPSSVSTGPTDTTAPSILAVTPRDINHVDVTFNEEVTKTSAENAENYLLVATGNALMTMGVPGDTMYVTPVLEPGKRTVTITVRPAMYHLMMSLSVYGVSDTHGNRMNTPVQQSFASANDADQTPPEIFSRSPAPGTMNAAIGAPVVIQFSEPLEEYSFHASWDSDSGPVDYFLDVQGTTYTLTPRNLLAYDEQQTISLSGIRDLIANGMANESWSFRTTRVVDNTPPTVVSTSPQDHALNVDVNSNISITFSEPVSQLHFTADLHPVPYGDGSWSEDGKTFTYDPWDALDEDRQYTLTVYPSGVFDLAGNTLSDVTTVAFSTGSSLASGRISGVIAGQPGTAAADPTGAIVVAGWYQPIGYAPVAGNDSYSITYLDDGPYALFAFKDTNLDGNPKGDGDAIGAYGADPAAGDFDFDTVQIVGGAHLTGIDFPIFDPSAVTGTVTYDGNTSTAIVGLFETTGFDLSTSQPVASVLDSPYGGKYSINNIDAMFPDGDYYVAAYIDANNSGVFDAATDPAGVYGGLATPGVVHIVKGSDAFNIDITVSDPVAMTRATSVAWPAPVKDGRFQRLCDRARAAGQQARGEIDGREASSRKTAP